MTEQAYLIAKIEEQIEAGDPPVYFHDVAAALRLSKRTLQRRLTQLGTSFRDIAQRVRAERAQRLLEAGLSSVSVAERLGFTHQSAFTRFFKRKTGKTPTEFRGAK